jgi:hypothetical protein
MDTNILNTLTSQIDRHAGGQPVGTMESHTLDSLCRRLLAPRPVVEELFKSGVLQPVGPVHKDGNSGLYSFYSDDLNDIRRAVLSALTELVVENSSGSPDEISLANSLALSDHAKSFVPNSDKKELSRALGSGCIMLGRNLPEEEPGPFQRAVAGAGKIAAIGGLGYAGASYLRGRAVNPTGSLLDQLRKGSRANLVTGRAIAGRLSAGASKVSKVLAGLSAS